MSLSDGHGRPYTAPTVRVGKDPSLRLKTHGPIQPMDAPGFWRRLFRRSN